MTQPDPQQLTLLSEKVASVLGDKLQGLVPQQLKLIDEALDEVLMEHNNQASEVTPAEIEGVYEMITEDVYPADFAAFSQKQPA